MTIDSVEIKSCAQPGRPGCSRTAPVRLLILMMAVFCLIMLFNGEATAVGVSNLSDYAGRLGRSEAIIEELIEQESPADVLTQKLGAIKRSLPAREDVDFGGTVVHVDNDWLHAALDEVAENSGGDIEQRHSMLTEIADRLAALRLQVDAAVNKSASGTEDHRARLESILARPEYRVDEVSDSTIERWLKRLRDLILRLLEKIFGSSASRAPDARGSGVLTGFRIVVVLAVFAAVAYGLFKLAQRIRLRRKPGDEPEAREILGEVIEENVSAADLLQNATELARQGEYRKAIRRAYIALLCELEQKGKLRLQRARTNRDYLQALRSEEHIYPNFSRMTGEYETVWYGQGRASEEDFRDFVSRYKETVD